MEQTKSLRSHNREQRERSSSAATRMCSTFIGRSASNHAP